MRISAWHWCESFDPFNLTVELTSLFYTLHAATYYLLLILQLMLPKKIHIVSFYGHK